MYRLTQCTQLYQRQKLVLLVIRPALGSQRSSSVGCYASFAGGIVASICVSYGCKYAVPMFPTCLQQSTCQCVSSNAFGRHHTTRPALSHWGPSVLCSRGSRAATTATLSKAAHWQQTWQRYTWSRASNLQLGLLQLEQTQFGNAECWNINDLSCKACRD